MYNHRAELTPAGADHTKRCMEKEIKTRGKIKPSKPVSFMQMILGGIFACVGMFVFIPQIAAADGPVWFGVIWTLLALGGALVGAINCFSDEGIPTEEFSYQSEPGNLPRERTLEERLTEAAGLRDKGLISEEEYRQKKAELIEEI